MTRDLEGRVALVTGGGRGIGRDITLHLASRGANVVVCYLRKRTDAEETCRVAESYAVKASAMRANVGDPADVDRLFDEIDEMYGRLDVLVSNAATGVIRGFDELDLKAWTWTMDANARALFLCAKRSVEIMRPGSRIVALSSAGSQRVLPGYMLVGTAKAAIEALCRYLAVELAPRGITVNVVAPGLVQTDALRHFPQRDELIAESRKRTPASRLTTPADVAGVVGFLTSEGASMITGHRLVVDGGAEALA